MHIADFGMGEKFFDGELEFSVGYVFQADQAPAASVGFKSAGTSAELFGKPARFDIPGTGIGVDVYGARLWQRFDASESVVGE